MALGVPILKHFTTCFDVIVIPWFVHLYEEISHNLYGVDYLLSRRTNHGITILHHFIRVDLAQ